MTQSGAGGWGTPYPETGFNVDFQNSTSHAYQSTTQGDSTTRGEHKIMCHPCPACTRHRKRKQVEIVARLRSAHIACDRHRGGQHQPNAPSRPPWRRRRPQRHPRARTTLWNQTPLWGARLRRSCAASRACLAHPSEHSRAPARAPHTTPQEAAAPRAAAALPACAVRRARRPCARRRAHRAAQERTGGSKPSARRQCAVSSIASARRLRLRRHAAPRRGHGSPPAPRLLPLCPARLLPVHRPARA